jgi:hypothetical protein
MDPGFQVRGGALKKIAPSRGRRENFWGISCEKSRFYAKKSYFSNFRGGAREIVGVFHVKNHGICNLCISLYHCILDYENKDIYI